MSKKAEFFEWCKRRGHVSSVMARDWGANNGFLRAERCLREFGEEGRCERLNWPQKVHLRLMRPEQTEIAWVRFFSNNIVNRNE